MELSLAARLFLVGVQLCWSFVMRVCRNWGMRLIVRPIAVHDIESKVVSFHSGCFSSIRLRSGPCDAVKRINFEYSHVIGCPLWYRWVVGGGSR